MDWGWINILLFVCMAASLLALGIAIWVLYFSEEGRARRIKKRELKDDLHRVADEAHAVQQQLDGLRMSLPEATPTNMQREWYFLRSEIADRLLDVESHMDLAAFNLRHSALKSVETEISLARQQILWTKRSFERLSVLKALIKDAYGSAAAEKPEPVPPVDCIGEYVAVSHGGAGGGTSN